MALTADVVVIGGGPGGYVAAIRAAQLGMSVACVEQRATLGGTCLNVGCIPSKALLHSSHLFHQTQHELAVNGVDVGSVKLNLPQLLKRKDDIVAGLTKGIDFLFKKNQVTRVFGRGVVRDARTVEVVEGQDASQTITAAKAIIIATGSVVAPLPNVEIDEEKIVSSTGALKLAKVPKVMAVVGGGYIGLEMASVWSRLGSKVTVVEYLDRILPGMDHDIAADMQKILSKQGLQFKLGTKVMAVEKTRGGVMLTTQLAAGGESHTMTCDVVLVAIGRLPNTSGLNLETVGVKLDERKRIVVDHHLQSSVPGIYAIGDVIQGPMLAHKAEEEGVAVAEIIAGQSGHVNYDIIPAVIYTAPEAACVGLTEAQLKKCGTSYRVGKFNTAINSRAKTQGVDVGFVKILSDATTDRVLGAHILGHEAGTLIAEIAAVMEFGGSAEDIARTCHAHPTLSEAVKEAASLAYSGKTIHA